MNLDNFKKYCEEHPYDKGQQEKIDKTNSRIMKDKQRAKEELERIDKKMQQDMQKADRAVEKFRRKLGGDKNA